MAKTEPVKPPRISVLDRRLQNPFGEPSFPIQTKDPTLLCRWFNGAISTDKIWRAKHVKGWEIVTPEMLVDLDQIGGYTLSAAGHVTRGERGQEVLMCMPRSAYDQIQAAKVAANNRNMGRPSAQREDALTAYGQVNPDGADAARRYGPTGGVRDSYERIERIEEQ